MIFIKKFVMLVILLVLAGCSSTPEDAIHNVYDAIKEGNMPKLISNSNYGTRGHFIKPALRECSVDKSKYIDNDVKLVEDCLREKYSGINVQIDSTSQISQEEADINITVQQSAKRHNVQLKVMKIKGNWIVVAGKE